MPETALVSQKYRQKFHEKTFPKLQGRGLAVYSVYIFIVAFCADPGVLFMNELIVTCAGCGKRYKGTTSLKKFKCAECQNLFSFPGSPVLPGPQMTCCSHCWTEIPLHEDLRDCPACAQKISPKFVGKAASAQQASISQSQHAVGDNDLQRQLAQVVKERDELIEIRKQQDRTMGSLLEQVAFAKSQRAASAEPAADAGWEIKMEVGQLKARVAALEDEAKTLTEQRDAGAATVQALQQKADEMQSRAAEFAAKAAELETRMSTTSTRPVMEGTGPVDHKAEQRVAELEAQLAQLEEAQAALVRERNEAIENLEQFRQAATQALTPLGVDCSKSIKRLMGETEAAIEKLREQQHEASRLLDLQIKASGEALKVQMKQVRREIVDRFAEVLGTPADMSSMQPAVPEDSSQQNSHAEHAA
jgi:hypothetical protein